MKKSYFVKLTTRTRNVRFLVDVSNGRANTTESLAEATVFARKADINAAFAAMSRDYRDQKWDIIPTYNPANR